MQNLNTAQALDAYAASVWSPRDLIEIRCLPTVRTGGPRPVSFWTTAGDLPGQSDRLRALNGADLNVYAGICPRREDGGSTDADVLHGRTTWIDFDGVRPDEALKQVEATGLPAPTMCVDSGHGCHIFHGLEEPATPEDLSHLVRDMAALLDADPTVKNPSRILRLPGLQNLKPPQAPCTIVFAEPCRRYSFDALRTAVPIVKPKTTVTTNRSAISTPRDILPHEAAKRAAMYVSRIEGAGPGGRTNAAFKVAAALVNDFEIPETEARSILTSWDHAANTPPIVDDYGDGKLFEIIQNAAKYAKREKGRLLNASSTDRSPAHTPSPARPKIALPDKAENRSLIDEFDAEGRGERRSLSLPWPRLTAASDMLRPGTVSLIAGAPGRGKSFFLFHALLHLTLANEKAILLPLEDDKAAAMRRLLALVAEEWSVIATDPESAESRKALLEKHFTVHDRLGHSVCENPRRAVMGLDGIPTVPPLPPSAVIDFIASTAKTHRVIMLDPLAQIDFQGRDKWDEESAFIRNVLGIAATTETSILIAVHTVKGAGRGGEPLTGELLQGVADLHRLAHTVLILDVHDEKTSDVCRCASLRETITHGHTLHLVKTRNGKPGRFAFEMGSGGRFRELGVIAPRHRRPNPSSAETWSACKD